MKNRQFKHLLALPVAAALIAVPAPGQTSTGAAGAANIMKKISERNPALHSYQTRMHVQVRQLNFPFLSPHLDGTAYYKRPGNYEIVFDSVPAYAKGLKKFFADIGDPIGWQKDSNISYVGVQSVDGHPYMTLRMTKKIYSDQIKETLAYIDPSTYEVVRMEWHYFNGGSITMTQSYRTENGFAVVASQHADIHIPHIRAVADSGFDKYQTNVPVSDTVFTANKN